jgi:hypothetical protein
MLTSGIVQVTIVLLATCDDGMSFFGNFTQVVSAAAAPVD